MVSAKTAGETIVAASAMPAISERVAYVMFFP
jgi:hypothetical protein